jgi:DNA transposition AAA+ family ATPase
LLRIEREINTGTEGKALYVYARIHHTPQTFLSEICATAGIPSRGRIDNLARKVAFFLGDTQTLLLVDEAQHLNHDTLEILRQLIDRPPYFGVVLAGSHDLANRLSFWRMEQWRSRVRKSIELNGPSEDECIAILQTEFPGIALTAARETIAECRVSAERTGVVKGKLAAKRFDYISARDFFWAIKEARESMAQSKAGAA